VTLQRFIDNDDHLRETLRLARDLCMGISAFFVDPEGWVQVEPSTTANNGAFSDRARELARSCLSHADAHGDAPFWSAEPTIAGQMPDESLACVVVPLHHEQEFLGLVGVIDDWLPDLDDEQLLGLTRIANDLAEHVQRRRAASATGVVGGETAAGATEAPEGEESVPAAPAASAPAHPGAGGSPEGSGARGDEAPAAVGAGAGATAGDAGGTPASLEGGGSARYEGFVNEVTDSLPEALLVVRDDGTVIFANQAATRMAGLPRDDVLGADLAWLLSTDPGIADAGTPPVSVASLLDAPDPERRLFLNTPHAEARPVHVEATRITSPLAGDCQVILLRDEPSVGRAERPFDALLDALKEGIVLCDAKGVVVRANAEAHRLSGLGHDAELVGRPYVTQTRLRTSDGALFTPETHPLLRALRGTEVAAEQVVVDDPQGERHHVVASARPFPFEGATGALLTLRDVTLEIREEARLSHLALHDALTGVANRYLLDEHLRRVLRTAKARGGTTALIFLDLDSFKGVNDRYGHDAGDEVLGAVASRVQNAVRSTELVARLGGDEFVVVCSNVANPGDVEVVVERLRKSLAAPYKVGQSSVGVTASVGWVIADRHLDTPESLLARADSEMYRSKRARSRSSVSHP
jgi:diguanylate cyclase (GGDEF)-like protein/PAS domain S-box-containing protein